MDNLFYNLDEPTAYTSHGPLQKASKKSTQQVTDYLESQSVYSRHKQLRYKFPRRKTFGVFVFSHLQVDLIELQEFAKSNKGYRYVLTIIDVFSRYSFIVALKRKTGAEVAKALEDTFEKINMFPTYILSDYGREFRNQHVKSYLDSRDIKLIHSKSEIKGSTIERFNRTWKGRLFKFFTRTNSVKWLESGKKIVDGINRSYHRTIKCTPEQVFLGLTKPADEQKRKEEEQVAKQPRYKVGQMIRLSGLNKTFRRGFRSGWTDEEFQIITALAGSPPVYRLVDTKGEKITGIVYEQEMVKAA